MHQLELFEKRIKITVCSSEGHNIHYIDAEEVIKFIMKLYNEFGYWVYIDSNCVNPTRLDLEAISFAKRIILTTPVVGG
jgi:hypothetical protein